MMMVNCFCGMVTDKRCLALFTVRPFSDAPLPGFEPTQNLNSGLVEWSCAAVIITTTRTHIHVAGTIKSPKHRNSSPK